MHFQLALQQLGCSEHEAKLCLAPFLIDDPDVVHAQLIYFEALWHQSREQ